MLIFEKRKHQGKAGGHIKPHISYKYGPHKGACISGPMGADTGKLEICQIRHVYHMSLSEICSHPISL